MKNKICNFLVDYAFGLAICGLILLSMGYCDAAIVCGSFAALSLCIATLILLKGVNDD